MKKSSPIILGLDLATITGWAIWKDGKFPYCGAVDFGWYREKAEHGHNGHMFDQLLAELEAHILVNGVTVLAYELAHHRAGPATRIGVGMNSIVLMAAAQYNVRVMEVHTATLKKWATGNGRAEKKDMIVAAQKLSGIGEMDDNTADAICVAAWAAERMA